jgi:hypothetical protein
LAAENKGAGIRDSLTNSFSNVGIGEVTKRLRWDTRDGAVSGKLKVIQEPRRIRGEKENILLHQHSKRFQGSNLNETIGNRRI